MFVSHVCLSFLCLMFFCLTFVSLRFLSQVCVSHIYVSHVFLMFLSLSIREVAQSHHSLEQELAHAVNASSKAMDVVYNNSKSSGVLNTTYWSLPSCPCLHCRVANVESD